MMVHERRYGSSYPRERDGQGPKKKAAIAAEEKDGFGHFFLFHPVPLAILS
jgi:hypothetical protein